MLRKLEQPFILSFLLVVMASVTACDDKPTSVINSALTIAELRAAPLEAEINGGRFELEAYPWRDFEPPDRQIDGTPLRIAAKLVELDSMAITDSLTVTRVFAIFEDGLWKTTPTGEKHTNLPSYIFEFMVRGGPRWDTGVTIDVVAEVRASNGDFHLVRISDRIIMRTE